MKRRVLWRLELLYKETPEFFREVPGASCFLERLKNLHGASIAIATGCWLKEALFKLQASGLGVEGIPLATSDDHKNRMRIMEIAAMKAADIQGVRDFDHIVYMGDGPWDIQASHLLGYSFIGIGPRIHAFQETLKFSWFQDYHEIEPVIKSIAAGLES